MKRKFLIEIDMDSGDEDGSSDLSDLISSEWGYEVKATEITAQTHLARTISRNGPDEPHQYSTNTDIPERYQI